MKKAVVAILGVILILLASCGKAPSEPVESITSEELVEASDGKAPSESIELITGEEFIEIAKSLGLKLYASLKDSTDETAHSSKDPIIYAYVADNNRDDASKTPIHIEYWSFTSEDYTMRTYDDTLQSEDFSFDKADIQEEIHLDGYDYVRVKAAGKDYIEIARVKNTLVIAKGSFEKSDMIHELFKEIGYSPEGFSE
ncbi:MAG: hypothetical protein LBL82_02530 [Oscillospiraceae bacterium]|jgi:hypothetical protein|nr:hypothetical protein [Oscillospiraceae bacterium]